MITIKINNQDEFDIYYQGFVTGSSLMETRKTISQVRDEVQILDVFDSISSPDKDKILPTGDPVLKYKKGSLIFSKVQAQLLVDHMERVPWTTVCARKVIKAIDSLKAMIKTESDKEDKKDKKDEA